MTSVPAEKLRKHPLRVITRVVLGPWPIRPMLSFVIVFLVNLYAANALVALSLENVGARFGRAIPLALMYAVVVGGVLALCNAFGRSGAGAEPSRTRYLVTMACAGSAFGLMNIFVRVTVNDSDPGWTGVRLFIVRGILFMLLIHAAAGLNDERLREQVSRTRRAYQELSEQRRVIVESEERARGLVARFLHDRVQTAVVAISLQMRNMRDRAPAVIADELGSLIEELEQVRTVDIRTASRRLSPDIPASGLASALRDLFDQYGRSLDVEVDIDGSLGRWSHPSAGNEQECLGVYRIIEQAVLNAAGHGHASRVFIRLEPVGTDIRLSINDDGAGLPDGPRSAGTGTAIIKAWVSLLGGDWVVGRSSLGGAQVTVTFPIHD